MGPIKSVVFSGMVLVVLLLGCFIAPPVLAQPWEFILAESNELPDGGQYGTVSLDYIFDGAPVDVFVQVVPILELAPATEFNVNAALGARFFF